MQVRFKCPACKGTHIADVPETTVYMTCATTNKAVQLRITAGGDVKCAVVGQESKGEIAADDEE